MFYFDNGTTKYEFEDTDLNYFYLQGLTIKVVDVHDVTTTIIFLNHLVMQTEINRVVRQLHKQLATIGGLLSAIGVIYWVNCANIYSHGLNSANITVTFKGSPTNLVITCLSSTKASMLHYPHLQNKYTSNNLSAYKNSKTIRYVNPNTAQIEGVRYKTMQSAIDASSSGNFVVAEAGNYLNQTVKFKAGVDIELEKGAEFFYNDATLGTAWTDLNGVANCKVFGQGVFYNNRSNVANGEWMFFDLKNNSDIFFEFDKVMSANRTTNANFHINKGSLRLSGNTNYGHFTRAVSDITGTGCVVDNDVLVTISEDGDTLYFPLDAQITYYCLRNGYFENNGIGQPAAMFALNNSEPPVVDIFNTRNVNKNKRNDAQIMITGGGYAGSVDVSAFNSYFQVHDNISLFFLDSNSLKVYNDCYTNSSNFGESILGTGTLHVVAIDLAREWIN